MRVVAKLAFRFKLLMFVYVCNISFAWRVSCVGFYKCNRKSVDRAFGNTAAFVYGIPKAGADTVALVIEFSQYMGNL